MGGTGLFVPILGNVQEPARSPELGAGRCLSMHGTRTAPGSAAAETPQKKQKCSSSCEGPAPARPWGVQREA